MAKFPILIIAATQSGSGKTTIVSGLLATLKMRGLKVQAYKIGPDYIDPSYHEIASGNPSHNLDTWLVGKEKLGEIFFSSFGTADIAIIEGVMGLYDGGRGGISSTAEVAKILDAPVILVIDAKSMGTSVAAVALGFREFDKSINLAGVILNRIGSDSHRKMIVDALDELGIKCFGAIRRDAEFVLPERHLGLVPASENNFDEIIKKFSIKISEQLDIDALLDVAHSISDINFEIRKNKKITPVCKIAVARDEAFSFYYEQSLREFKNFGAEIVFFSPLHDECLPKNIDGLILGGGFPEIFASQLQENRKIRAEIKALADRGLPIFAECGGYMYLMDSIADFDGKIFDMCGIIPSCAIMTDKLQMVGYVEATLTKNCIIGKIGDKFHAHEFHFSKELSTVAEEDTFCCKKLRTDENYFAGFSNENIVASYLHIHFSGCESAAKNFVTACINFHNSKI